MAKFIPDYVLEGSPARFAEGNELRICIGQPTTYAEAVGANSAGSTSLTPGLGNGDFTIADGDTSGRKVTVAAQSGISLTASGSADHVAVVDTTNSRLLGVTTMPAQSVTSGNTADTGAFKFEVRDPA